jgi:ATP-binding cassette subfamily F protein uup
MNLLSVDQLTKHYGERTLFEGISFGLAKGDKVALIANNGTGKSTLLRILSGAEVADAGTYSYRDGIRISFLEQDPELAGEGTVNDYIQRANASIVALKNEYEMLSQAAANGDSDTLAKLERIQNEMDIRKAWDYERRLEETLSKLGLHQLDQSIQTLSGGQRKRLALAVTLVDEPELLILDEPTNHLDIDMVEWLEGFLSQSSITLLMVTHDRYFLDRVCNVILEMHRRKLYKHEGNYGYFLEKRAERQEVQEIERDKAQKLMKKELEWMRRQPKARTTKSKARIDAFHDIEDRAKVKDKDLELKLDVKMSRLGGKILELKKVNKQYDQKTILKGFDYTFKSGERIGIIGQNGVGKTTFLNILTGKESPDSGKVNVGDTIVYGYYNQSGLTIKADQRVIDVLKDIADVIVLSNGKKLSASAFLEHFMFTPEMQYTMVSKLSGGERRRLHLMTVLMRNPNFLILDEPTNDLDLLTLQKLEEFLETFSGCLMVVSHDRYFLDKMVDHLFIFKGDGVVQDYWGRYSDYKAERLKEGQSNKPNKPEPTKATVIETPQNTIEKKVKKSFKHQFEFQELEKEIPKLEMEKSKLEATIASGKLSYEELTKLSSELSKLNEVLDVKIIRWMELDEME